MCIDIFLVFSMYEIGINLVSWDYSKVFYLVFYKILLYEVINKFNYIKVF